MFSSKGKRRLSLGSLPPKEGGASGSPFQILLGEGGEGTVERRTVTSRYCGSKISRSYQPFLTETAICIFK